MAHLERASTGTSFAELLIDVVDTGSGIAAEDLAKLFGEFQQLDASSAKTHQSTGLGLALTKGLAEAQGGRVEVRSTPGEGSTFSAILPRVMSIVPADEALGPIVVLPDGHRTVLVVDDDPRALKLADAALRELGYEPVCTTSAEDGYMSKPIDTDALPRMVAGHLAQRVGRGV